jgi:hypothetical protein
MATPYQYMLLTSTPEKEARFAALKKKCVAPSPRGCLQTASGTTIVLLTRLWFARHGSFMAFHGSPMENWHSILRNGLRNMSTSRARVLSEL